MAKTSALTASPNAPVLLQSLATSNNAPEKFLPASLSSFVGRHREIKAICALVRREEVRLLTLTGPGGVGKTRLAIEAAARLRENYADGAGFVALAGITDPNLVIPAVAQALGIPEADERAALPRLKTFLSRRQVLLVLDNVEHLVAAGPSLTDLLASCPSLSMVVTSRRAIGVYGEHVFRVPPLTLARVGTAADSEELEHPEAIQLFIERARSAVADFEIDDANRDAIVTICRQLDGLPLAIELAAARLAILPPSVLASRLTRRLPLLTGGPRDAPKRLQTMRDAIAWSYDLLSAAEQACFRRLSVCVGGFSLEAAEVIISGDVGRAPAANAPADPPTPLTAIMSLVRGSFLHLHPSPAGESRFLMLETIREYGLEQLATLDEEDAAHGAHAAYFLDLAEQAGAYLWGSEQAEWLDRLEEEQGNLRAALLWSVEGDPDTALRLAGALWPFWRLRFHAREGHAWLERALAAAPAAATPARSTALLGSGTLAWAQGDYARAEQQLTEALNLAEEREDGVHIAHLRLALGRLAWDKGELERARAWFDEALARFQGGKNQHGIAMCVHGLALVAYKLGAYANAAELFNEALAVWKELGYPWGLTCCIPGHLADVARRQGHHRRAATLYRQSLALNWQQKDRENITWNLIGLAAVAAARGDFERVARLLGAASAVREAIDAPLMPDERADYDLAAAGARATLGGEAFDAAWAEGRALAVADVVTAEVRLPDAAEATDAATSTLPGPPEEALTAREAQILRLVVAGWRDKEIADELFISHRTVQTHMGRLFRKLKARSRTAAAAAAVQRGLV
ncbi:MAG TPA: LuxR C-terminal-related transcriptional regulator [Thermomicrobiales bacterium]|nr:LuxR C-terminal-related transcriptional regulator [Thermomicrobiales bacterium]